jgi:hypothetical protein
MDEQATSLDLLCVPIDNCRIMRLLHCVFLIVACTIPLTGRGVGKVGYVDCSLHTEHLPTPVYSTFHLPVATLNCGEKVQVLGREGPWLRIASNDSTARYINFTAISRKKNRFVALDLPAPPDPGAVRPRTGKVPPRAIYTSNPEYTQKALKAGIHGVVIDNHRQAGGLFDARLDPSDGPIHIGRKD